MNVRTSVDLLRDNVDKCKSYEEVEKVITEWKETNYVELHKRSSKKLLADNFISEDKVNTWQFKNMKFECTHGGQYRTDTD